MIDHMALLREFYAPAPHISPGLVGMEDCESLFTHLKNRKMVAEKYLVRHFLSAQQFTEEGELDNAYWLPGTENPADGLSEIKSGAVCSRFCHFWILAVFSQVFCAL